MQYRHRVPYLDCYIAVKVRILTRRRIIAMNIATLRLRVTVHRVLYYPWYRVLYVLGIVASLPMTRY